jgi:hypothetical protein
MATDTTSFSIFEFMGELAMVADGKQPPWIPRVESLSAAAAEPPTPSIVILRHPGKPGGDGPTFELKFHNLGRGSKKALATAFAKAAEALEKGSVVDDRMSMEDRGTGIDVTAALRDPEA